MKKLFILFLSVFCFAFVNAQNYKHSIGVTAGGLNGVSYKGFIFGIEGLALQADLGVRVSVLGPRVVSKYKYSDGESYKFVGKWDKAYMYFTFEANPNIVYQSSIHKWASVSLDWIAGGGLSLGLMRDKGTTLGKYTEVGGKFGLNAFGGLELGLKKVPIAVGLDFRPGYGLGFWRHKSDFGFSSKETLSFFDWTLAASVRYCF